MIKDGSLALFDIDGTLVRGARCHYQAFVESVKKYYGFEEDISGINYAGKTDLLVTWLYKLTITNKDFNLGAVIGIIVFIILATLSLLTYRKTGSYKDEEAFQ